MSPRPSDVAVSATGLLKEFSEYGVLTWADVHPALHISHLYGERDERVQLAIALTVRALRAGSLCIDLTQVSTAADAWEAEDDTDDAPGAIPAGVWPDPEAWSAAVIAGGPGTGKTRVIAGIVEESAQRHGGLIGLAAPTGKAAARMTESLRLSGLEGHSASTIHRLLGYRPGSRTRFRHDESNPLPHDLVIVDEVSMVSMTLMARLVAALKPGSRLVLVGDPDQLASVEAGAVLADLTRAPALAGSVVRLTHNFRFAGAIAQVSAAIRDGDADQALSVLTAGHAGVRLVAREEAEGLLAERAVSTGRNVVAAARADDPATALAALAEHRLLCAHRAGPWGVQHWSRLVTDWLADAVPGLDPSQEFYVGRPVLVTANTPELGLFNGDTGVVVAGRDRPELAFETGAGLRRYSPYLLDGLQTVHAMTVHKSQGSQFRSVSVLLPPASSRLLTRELLYTAVTRASDDVLLIGDEQAVRTAIARPAARTSGLTSRLG